MRFIFNSSTVLFSLDFYFCISVSYTWNSVKRESKSLCLTLLKYWWIWKNPTHSLRLCHIFWHVCKHYTLQKNISCTYLYLWSTETIVTRIPRWTLAARTPFYVWSVTIHVTACMKNYTQKINASNVPVLWVWSSLNLFNPVFVNMFVKKPQQNYLPFAVITDIEICWWPTKTLQGCTVCYGTSNILCLCPNILKKTDKVSHVWLAVCNYWQDYVTQDDLW